MVPVKTRSRLCRPNSLALIASQTASWTLSVLAAPPPHFRVEIERFGMVTVGGQTALGWEGDALL